MALILRNGGSQNPDRWLKEPRNNQIKGVWGLLESKTLESDITANEENREFPEGKAIFEIHLRHERNVQLVKDAKKRFLEEHDGQIFCEACGFNFYQVYGDIGRNFIEVHHLSKPVATMKRGDMTKVEDLAMLCANCHRMIHKIRPWISDRNKLKIIVKNK